MVKPKTYRRTEPYYDLCEAHGYDIVVDHNHIYLMGHEAYISSDQSEPGVEFIMANRFIRNLDILMRKSNDPITITLKTGGGYWNEGMAIFDAIQTCPNHTTIINYADAESMSSIILQAADKRIMMPHSTFMFHDGSAGSSGTIKQFLTQAEQIKKTYVEMIDIYVASMKKRGKYSKWSSQRIEAWLREQMDRKEEVHLTPIEAIELGFADEIFGAA